MRKFEVYIRGQRTTVYGDIITGPGGAYGVHDLAPGYRVVMLEVIRVHGGGIQGYAMYNGYGGELARGLDRTTALSIAAQLSRCPESPDLGLTQRILRDHIGGVL